MKEIQNRNFLLVLPLVVTIFFGIYGFLYDDIPLRRIILGVLLYWVVNIYFYVLTKDKEKKNK